MLTLTAVVAAAIALPASWWAIGRIRALAPLDQPNERSSHSVPTPRGAGIAVTAITLIAAPILCSLFPAIQMRHVVGYLAGALIVSAVSLLDDIRSVSAGPRFAAHAAGAVLVIATCGYASSIILARDVLSFGAAGAVLTVIWMIGLTNAYNFMDGIDGIAGGQAVVAGIGWAALGLLSGEPAFVLIGTLLAATNLGFLAHNWPPARIFMGDVGSAFLGFSFAVLPFLGNGNSGRYLVPAALFVWPFLFDTIFTFLRRLSRRERVFAAHRSHLYQRLNIAGHSHKTVSTLYTLLAAAGAAAAIAFPGATQRAQLIIVATGVAAGVALWMFVVATERRRPAA